MKNVQILRKSTACK